MPSRRPRPVAPLAAALLVSAAACGDADPGSPPGAGAAFRVVNGGLDPLSVVVDGATVVASLAPGTISPPLPAGAGSRRVALRGAGGAVASVDVALTPTDTPTVAARRLGAVTTAAVLADTGRLVPPGASKLRVIHLAASTPFVDVWRTQPDHGTPVGIAFPFPYGLETPYLQSRPGSWELRASRVVGDPDRPAPAEGWGAAAARLTVAVPDGERRTVVVLDAPGGGVRLALLDEP